jgi:hypothetical protein
MHPYHTFCPVPLTHILILTSHPYTGLLSGLFPSGFLTKILYAFIISPMCGTCHTHVILLDLITLIIFGKVRNILFVFYTRRILTKITKCKIKSNQIKNLSLNVRQCAENVQTHVTCTMGLLKLHRYGLVE